MKNHVLFICLFLNYLLILMLIIITFSIFLKSTYMLDFFNSKAFTIARFILTIPVLGFWIHNLIIWSKKDKSIGRFFLLFFFNGLYNPIYFRRILKNNWL